MCVCVFPKFQCSDFRTMATPIRATSQKSTPKSFLIDVAMGNMQKTGKSEYLNNNRRPALIKTPAPFL